MDRNSQLNSQPARHINRDSQIETDRTDRQRRKDGAKAARQRIKAVRHPVRSKWWIRQVFGEQ
jgi:hypothetical protein